MAFSGPTVGELRDTAMLLKLLSDLIRVETERKELEQKILDKLSGK